MQGSKFSFRQTCPAEQVLPKTHSYELLSGPAGGNLSRAFTLQICLVIALSFRCRCWRLGFVNGQVVSAT